MKEVFVSLPEKYPQLVCGNVRCNNKLDIPNIEHLTSKLCKCCAGKFFRKL